MTEYVKDTEFPQSSLLIQIIEKEGWQLFDLTHPEDKAYGWDEIDQMRPAAKLLIGHNYLLIPRQSPGQKPKEAYEATLNLKPALAVNNINEPQWIWIKTKTSNLPLFKFTRLAFLPKALMAFTPETEHDPDPDDIGIEYDLAINVFQRFFGTATKVSFQT